MQLCPAHAALSSFPFGALTAPETWKSSTRPAAWSCHHEADLLFGDEMFLEDQVYLSPELDAAYDRAIDAAFAKVMDLFCGPARQAG